jgi:hypothetical protein
MPCVLIDNGKKPNELYNARLGFWLPPQTPYGNFQLKFMKIVERLDEANRKIEESFGFWERIIASPNGMQFDNVYPRHVFANEQAIYMMRRAADELISLIWCLSEHEKTGAYPETIKVDCLGDVLKTAEKKKPIVLYQPHLNFIEILNEVANAFKHSFINSDINLFGAQEPCVHALGLKDNRLSAGEKFHNVALAALVRDYSAFYQTCLQWLRDYSERNRGS